MKVVTSQFFGSLNSIHYRAIRAAVNDFKKKIPRTVLNIISKRATPKQWARYAIAKTVIKLYNKGCTRMGILLRQNSYVNDRNPGRAVFFGNAKRRSGRHCILNKLHIFKDIKFDWIGDISDDALRQRLKKQFITF